MKRLHIILNDLLAELNVIASSSEEGIRKYQNAIGHIDAALKKVEEYIREYNFEDQNEEIMFFKTIKPQLDGQLLYHMRLLHYEYRAPISYNDKIHFYRLQLRKIKRWHRLNKDFCTYMTQGHEYNDHHYFLRTDQPDAAFYENYGYRYSPKYNTRMSFRVAKLISYKLLQDYLIESLLNLGEGIPLPKPNNTTLVWVSPKVLLAEVIYSFYAARVFGNVSLHVITKYICDMFSIRFANEHKVKEEIRLRKKNRTAGLDFLRLQLIRQMDQDDEFAL